MRAHLPLVDHHVAAVVRRLPAHVLRDELVSTGRQALELAARAYDEDQDVPFPDGAAHRIAAALVERLGLQDWAGAAPPQDDVHGSVMAAALLGRQV